MCCLQGAVESRLLPRVRSRRVAGPAVFEGIQMKQVRLVVAGFAVGLLMVVTSACSPPAVSCSALSCTGCCDSAGKCQGGGTATACGKGGSSCNTCAATQSCTANACVTGGSGGGAGGGTGGVGGG